MVLFNIPFLIPRFNWEREVRGFMNFLGYYAVRAQYMQAQAQVHPRRSKAVRGRKLK